MTTAAQLDSKVSSGMGGLREHMKAMKITIKDNKDKCQNWERETDAEKRRLMHAYGRKAALREKISDKEEESVKVEEKLREMTKRLADKELFLKESRKFNDKLESHTPEKGEVDELSRKVEEVKEIYSQNYAKCQNIRNEKIELEQRVEQIEIKAQDSSRRVRALQTEVEYNTVEEGRRSEGCKTAIDKAFKTEKSCLETQKAVEEAWVRKEKSERRVESLEKQVDKVEQSIENVNYERKRMESTLKEMLMNIRRQQQYS